MIELALAHHFNPYRNTMLFEAPIREYLADVLVITPNDYATEIEVKRSIADWRADLTKDKWRHGLPDWISRFIYCVPAELGIPAFVPDFAGVLHVQTHRTQWESRINIARAPKRLGKVKVPEKYKAYLLNRTYMRYWAAQLDRLHKAEEHINRNRLKVAA